jgi:WD40 repeat protein
LKCVIEEGPDDKTDINFIRWHPKANLIMVGGTDNMIWLLNGANGKFIDCLSGHKNEVLEAKFSVCDGGKFIISSSADKSIKVWKPQ